MTEKYKKKRIRTIKNKRAKFKTTTKTYKRLSSAISRKRKAKKPKHKKTLFELLFKK